jgi:hypothetical protein
MRLLLHLVDEFVPRDRELLLDDIAHGHQIFETLLQHCIYTDTIY